ncbi:MAG: (d)CMP kinase [Blastocatellia bacterium]
MEDRDRRDSSRATAPLRPADDAVIIDTTALSRDDLLGRLLELVHSRR